MKDSKLVGEKTVFNPTQYTLEEILKPQNCALLVIDMQNDFMHPKGFFAKRNGDIIQMQSIVPNIQELIDVAHDKNISVIFTKIHDEEDKLNKPGLRRKIKWQEAGEDPLVGPKEGTFGAEFYKLKPEAKDTTLIKYDWSAFTGRDDKRRSLEEILKEKDITTLVITGVKTEVCVGTTARDAYMRGYFVVVPREAVGSDNKELHEANLRNLDPIYGDVVGEEKIIKIWSNSS